MCAQIMRGQGQILNGGGKEKVENQKNIFSKNAEVSLLEWGEKSCGDGAGSGAGQLKEESARMECADTHTYEKATILYTNLKQ